MSKGKAKPKPAEEPEIPQVPEFDHYDAEGHVKPWDKQPAGEDGKAESPTWYDRFHTFMLMGPSRSILAVYQEDWTERKLAALDKKIRKEQDKAGKGGTSRRRAREADIGDPPKSVPSSWVSAARDWGWRERASLWDAEQRRIDTEEWTKRREALRDRSWSLANKVLDRVEQMLAWPIAEQTLDDDGQKTVIKPAGWQQRDIAPLGKTGVEMARTAAGLDSSRVTIVLDDLKKYTSAELEELSRGVDPAEIEARHREA